MFFFGPKVLGKDLRVNSLESESNEIEEDPWWDVLLFHFSSITMSEERQFSISTVVSVGLQQVSHSTLEDQWENTSHLQQYWTTTEEPTLTSKKEEKTETHCDIWLMQPRRNLMLPERTESRMTNYRESIVLP